MHSPNCVVDAVLECDDPRLKRPWARIAWPETARYHGALRPVSHGRGSQHIRMAVAWRPRLPTRNPARRPLELRVVGLVLLLPDLVLTLTAAALLWDREGKIGSWVHKAGTDTTDTPRL